MGYGDFNTLMETEYLKPILKGQFTKKELLILMMFGTCISLHFSVEHKRRYSGGKSKCCFGPHWISLYRQKQFFKTSIFVFDRKKKTKQV